MAPGPRTPPPGRPGPPAIAPAPEPAAPIGPIAGTDPVPVGDVPAPASDPSPGPGAGKPRRVETGRRRTPTGQSPGDRSTEPGSTLPQTAECRGRPVGTHRRDGRRARRQARAAVRRGRSHLTGLEHPAVADGLQLPHPVLHGSETSRPYGLLRGRDSLHRRAGGPESGGIVLRALALHIRHPQRNSAAAVSGRIHHHEIADRRNTRSDERSELQRERLQERLLRRKPLDRIHDRRQRHLRRVHPDRALRLDRRQLLHRRTHRRGHSPRTSPLPDRPRQSCR
ncbi:hypothetical protein QP028_12185 [Corynebacterium suedekumii]|nr:hypothetical protein QP028_12185 [Corynebacterium suedekumii]